jgi:ribulose 1,5-bisphosphate synthetase/thiazole synthase
MKTFQTDALVVGAEPAGLTACALPARERVHALIVSE